MGAEEIISAVADSGPLVHLTEIKSLSLLRTFAVLHVPDAVWSETIQLGRVLPGDLADLGIVQRHTLSELEVEQFTQENGLETLHDGERECLYLCGRISISVLLTDDLAVRDAARNLRITPVGSLGVVVRAYRDGRISLTDAERHISDLYSVSSLFVTRAIVELAMEQLRAHSRPD